MTLLEISFSRLFSSALRPGLHPIPSSVPLTIEAALCAPVVYYVALLLLAPPPPDAIDSPAVKTLRGALALLAGVLFFRLPLVYHVPQSIGLTYQLGLVGLYGGCRVLDAFFISPYIFGHIPRRVKYSHQPRVEAPGRGSSRRNREWSDGRAKVPFMGNEVKNETSLTLGESQIATNSRRSSVVSRAGDSYLYLTRTLSGPDPLPVLEIAITEDGWPHTFAERASWALELELSMRGVGFTWTTADVRHTRKTWLPTVGNRMHSIFVHVPPIQLGSWLIIRSIYITHLAQQADLDWSQETGTELFDEALPLVLQLLLTTALGAFLMSAFSLGHSLFAIVLHPLSPSPLAFFPPLYTTRIWDITSVRGFWSYGWHRLFTRLFLVYGVWPGEWLERKLTGKKASESADVGKVLGGFLASAFVHSFAVRGVLGGDWSRATGEAKFFALNGIAVVLEGVFVRLARSMRKHRGLSREMWYDAPAGRLWWVAVLLGTGRNFARGWVKAGLVREMAFL